MSADKYAEKTLFTKLGIKDYQWISLKGQTHTGGGLFLRPRDALKIGQLICDNGRWSGEQVVSDSWVEESTGFLLSAEIVPGTRNWGYGYQWWREEFNVQGKVYPAIFAAGYGGQFLWIVPELRLVVLALHHNPTDFKYIHTLNWVQMESIIIPAVLANPAL